MPVITYCVSAPALVQKIYKLAHPLGCSHTFPGEVLFPALGPPSTVRSSLDTPLSPRAPELSYMYNDSFCRGLTVCFNRCVVLSPDRTLTDRSRNRTR